MANTKVPIELSSTPGIVDNSTATAITIDGTGAATFSGNVGIGVSAPNEKLESSGAIRVLGTTATSQNSGTLSFNGTLFNIESRGPNVSNRGTIGFYQATSNGSSAIQSMLLDASGNLLVGTTSSSGSKLYVSSNAGGATVGDFRNSSATGVGMYIAAGDTASQYALRVADYANNHLMTVDGRGNLLVGTTNVNGAATTDGFVLYEQGTLHLTRVNDYVLYLNRRGTDGSLCQMVNDGAVVGSISVSGSSTAYNTSSDYRLKEDDVPMTGATERVKALRPINFAWKVDGSRTDGFFAHEAQEVVPECSTGTKDAMRDEEYEVTPAVEEVKDEDGNVTTEAVAAVMGTRSVPDYQGIDQSKLVPLLTATIQELIARIEALEGA